MPSACSDEQRFAVIIPAAGASSRFVGFETRKPFAELNGTPVWIRTVSHFIHRADVSETILVAAEADLPAFRESASKDILSCVKFAPGGATRAESVLNGLQQLSFPTEFVAVHDAARPLLTDNGITELFAAARAHDAVVPGVPVTSTVKQVAATGRVEKTLDRSVLQLAQTPQVVRRELLERAYGTCDGAGTFTDEASLIEASGHPVFVVPGWPENIKITTAEDFLLAEFLLGRHEESS